MHRFFLFSIAMVWVVIQPGSTAAQDKNAKPRVATEPEQAVKFLLEAAKADDAAGFVAQLSADSRAARQAYDAFEGFLASLDEKFGKEKGRPNLPRRSAQSGYKDGDIEIRGQSRKSDERFAVTVWKRFKQKDKPDAISEETWFSVKQSDGWKVLLPLKGEYKYERRAGPDGTEFKISVLNSREQSAQEIALLQKFYGNEKQAIEALTKEVQAGKYQTRAEAQRAYGELRKRLNEAKDGPLKKLREEQQKK